ncbi:GntR family transcriptional regulator [Rhizobium leguminosarum]|uniref:GntR family transcriptional regulator n=1 Tax=Rhizobium leguminosarum TaxID=384 RepID=A0A4Q8Y0Z7_RHILE|nr:GntR family transcriptional regulator [Rhizobium leguminosarum]TAU89756.1 GntR family transcriptional regulator [Rhizobium leguminosarum]TAV54409.1 GntR family transcriptional regulator [Rhizobium leguminosarum]TAX56561.1 GntR family transcriptional regulator [Rhizobium leguminosarum]TAX61066.1 GntR family transcriptional regulator [Rhizobium leguminosarum]TAX72923.1 GntR family transcriptional regulator [Rhizobium leguminosarum]
MSDDLASILSLERLQAAGTGPLYVKLRRMLEEAVRTGTLGHGDALPPERDIAEFAAVSRVTVRKAIDELVADGLLVRRHGSGTFVAKPVSKVEQRLSQLTSFTEDMARRGMSSRSEWLHKGIHTPSPDEMMILGLGTDVKVSRLSRLRIADDQPLAIENASVSGEFLPDPSAVTNSLYAELERLQVRPVRAVQRISATNMKEADAQLLGVSAGAAGLSIERISYLGSGRAVEFTRSLYRGDAYDFVAELTIAVT